jgi:hypothetical protein
LPDELTTVAFRVDYLGHLLDIEIGHEVVTIESPASPRPPVHLRIAGERLIVPAGAKVVHPTLSQAKDGRTRPRHVGG